MYDINWLLSKEKQGEKLDFLFFWGHTQKIQGIADKSCFSQWFPSEFTVDGIRYYTAEHWMMAEKARLFDDKRILASILKNTSPAEVKKLGRRIQNYDEAAWQAVRFEAVIKGNIHKFEQNPNMKACLCDTGNKIIVEASPYDNIWGIGLHATDAAAQTPRFWQGTNLLGFALMHVRDELQ